MISFGIVSVSADYMITAYADTPIILSFYDRSSQMVRSAGAYLNNSSNNIVMMHHKKYCCCKNGYDVFIAPIMYGKEKFYHGIAISKEIGSKYLITYKENINTDFYNFMMKNFSLPLLPEWSEELYNHLKKAGYISDLSNDIYGENTSSRWNKSNIVLSMFFNEEQLKNTVSELLKSHVINITEKEQKPLAVSNMDEYFKKYGSSVVENLEKQLKPLTPLDATITNCALKNKRLYPQQAAQLNGIVKRLQKGNYCILNNGMGTGKTIEAAATIEAFFVDKWLKNNKGSTLKECYRNPEHINYRNIIMCPGHLVEKWANEIVNEIPYSKVTILNDLSQLISLYNNGPARHGKEFFIVSKDFAKLSYQDIPVPKTRKKGYSYMKICKACKSTMLTPDKRCKCGSSEFTFKKTGNIVEGMVCPYCGKILRPYETVKEDNNVLDFDSFTSHSTKNDRCFFCQEPLWEPYVPNIGNSRKRKWNKVTCYANKAHKGTKTIWMHSDYEKLYFSGINEAPLNRVRGNGVRKISPALFIKKKLKNFFDFAVFDEAHLYKGGGTAQGNTMHALINASKKQLALTGTIAGGYASHLFYLLFRLDSHKMRKLNFQWNNVMDFVRKYGQIETEYKTDEDANYNASSKGKQIGSPKEKPGISPLIFTDFLLDSTVFLDLSDMSKYLPALKEKVEIVSIPSHIETSDGDIIANPEKEMLTEYQRVIEVLTKMFREKGGHALMSSMLQFSLSYLDHPYSCEPIKHPLEGYTIIQPADFDTFKKGCLLSKEKRLIEIVNNEMAEKRNIVVYAEFTNSANTCVTYHLKELIENNCNLYGKVAVIESGYPQASEREAWMHKKAAEGIKVFITNPRNVETGLDFCFEYEGVTYNYPTLIFYQMGYSLFTIWQASRRSFRLNQREECRTYYLAVAGTVQQTIISLIAQKMAATSAIQGKFSAEGLSAMAQGVDVRLKLAQALSSNSEDNIGANLQDMFDAIQEIENPDDDICKSKRMAILSELLEDGVIENTLVEVIKNGSKTMVSPTDSAEIFQTGIFNIFDVISSNVTASKNAIITKKERKKSASIKDIDGQISIFTILN